MDWLDRTTIIRASVIGKGDPSGDLGGWSVPMVSEWEMAQEGSGGTAGNARSPFFSDFLEAD
jgi:hypothetical protein